MPSYFGMWERTTYAAVFACLLGVLAMSGLPTEVCQEGASSCVGASDAELSEQLQLLQVGYTFHTGNLQEEDADMATRVSSTLLDEAMELEHLVRPDLHATDTNLPDRHFHTGASPPALSFSAFTRESLDPGELVKALAEHPTWSRPLALGAEGKVIEALSDGRFLVEFGGDPPIRAKMLRAEIEPSAMELYSPDPASAQDSTSVGNTSAWNREQAIYDNVTEQLDMKLHPIHVVVLGLLVFWCLFFCIWKLVRLLPKDNPWTHHSELEEDELAEAWVRFPKS